MKLRKFWSGGAPLDPPLESDIAIPNKWILGKQSLTNWHSAETRSLEKAQIERKRVVFKNFTRLHLALKITELKTQAINANIFILNQIYLFRFTSQISQTKEIITS